MRPTIHTQQCLPNALMPDQQLVCIAAFLLAQTPHEDAAACCRYCMVHLAGVETLLDDMATADSEWHKLQAVPGLLEPWNDVKDKWQVATDEFKLVILDAHGRKKAEQGQFQSALQTALSERDQEAKKLLIEFEKSKKRMLKLIAEKPVETDEQVRAWVLLYTRIVWSVMLP